MKKMKINLAAALAMIALPALTGCGSSSNGSQPSGTTYQTVCTTNAYGQQTCTQVANGSGGCIPVTPGGTVNLSFVGSGNLISGVYLVAGNIPGGSAAGTLSITSTAPVNGSGYMYSGYSDPGTILSLSGPQSGGSLSGSITLDSLMTQSIVQDTSGITGQSYGTSCISGIAIQGQYYQSVPGFTGNVYLYLNNTSHGYVVPIY